MPWCLRRIKMAAFVHGNDSWEVLAKFDDESEARVYWRALLTLLKHFDDDYDLQLRHQEGMIIQATINGIRYMYKLSKLHKC